MVVIGSLFKFHFTFNWFCWVNVIFSKESIEFSAISSYVVIYFFKFGFRAGVGKVLVGVPVFNQVVVVKTEFSDYGVSI
jgi:hypothetical protein